jgi:hypothetical protein
MLPGFHITAHGAEYEITCRAKCGPYRGWFTRPCMDGVPVRDRERWIADEDITGVLDKRGQYLLSTEMA